MKQASGLVSNPAGPAPGRRPGSIRRTMSIDTGFPQGHNGPLEMVGIGRDLFTPSDGSPPVIVASDRLRVVMSPDRHLVEVRAEPARPAVAGLAGFGCGSAMRREIDRLLPDERADGTPLYLMLDDLTGASLVANWAWSRWREDWMAKRNIVMEDVCIGFRAGASSLNPDGTGSASQHCAPVPPLADPDDPIGWHALAAQNGAGMRRARRIDVWIDDVVRIDTGFQDSANTAGESRIAVHEYALVATADPVSLKLLSLEAEPRILPYPECSAAAERALAMLGTPLPALRMRVLEELRRSNGCTHLNDALRALGEVPQLLAALAARAAGQDG